MSLGDLVLVVLPGAYGKPRPAVVVQGDTFTAEFDSVIACPLTTSPQQHPTSRVLVVANADNGLERDSTVMIEKITALPKTKIARRLGRLEVDELKQVDRCLAAVLSLA